MAEALRSDDRLPWLDAPRPASARPRLAPRAHARCSSCSGCSSPARSRSWPSSPGEAPRRRPGAVGNRVAPAADGAGASRPANVPTRQSRNAGLAATPIAPSAPVTATANARPSREPVRAAPAQGGARSRQRKRAPVRSRRRQRVPPSRLSVERRAPRADCRRSAATLARLGRRDPSPGPAGGVIQLGAYRTQPQADAAWWRLARVYPYLADLAADR